MFMGLSPMTLSPFTFESLVTSELIRLRRKKFLRLYISLKHRVHRKGIKLKDVVRTEKLRINYGCPGNWGSGFRR